MKLTHCIIAFILLGTTSCGLTGEDQTGGFFLFTFEETPVCERKIQEIRFLNDFDETLTIKGAGISPGTDPNGYFAIESLTIGNKEVIPAESGTLTNIDIPAQTSYSINIAFAPRESGLIHGTLLDIAYSAPAPGGVVQVELTGEALDGDGASCIQASEGVTVTYDGEYQLALLKMIAIIGGQEFPMSTEDTPFAGYQAYTSFILDVSLSQAEGSIFIPAIEMDDGFDIPPSVKFYSTIQSNTNVSTPKDITGTYDPSTGHLVVDFALHLETTENGRLIANAASTLSTQGVERPVDVTPSMISKTDIAFDNTFVPGTPIDPVTGIGVLVGASKISDTQGAVGDTVRGRGVLLWIQFQICELGGECPFDVTQ